MIRKEVKAGIALLDEKVPDWRAHIDLSILDMSSCSKCVVGQLFADLATHESGYAIGLDVLELKGGDPDDEDYKYPEDFGFACNAAQEDRDWVVLRDEWKAAIAERK